MTRETLLMATRAAEAEPALVEVGETEATLHLDDGDFLTFDLAELRAALGTDAEENR